ncbi:MAG: SDR family oxidoreductase [Sediminicola sp.]
MKIELQGKKALIGGSSSGIGLAIAKQLAESGASVTLMARNGEKLRAILDGMPRGLGQVHQYLEVDFTDQQKYTEIIGNYFEHNTVDILVNNTQGPSAGTATEKNVTDYQQAFDLLFKVVVHTTELALKGMVANKYGRVINIASVSVKEPLAYLVLSNSIRAAVTTWAKSLATEVAPHGITVNSTLTGYFDTERIKDLNGSKARIQKIPLEEVERQMLAQVPVGRFGHTAEYGYLVAFLASERASFITGTNIPIDGGYLKSM